MNTKEVGEIRRHVRRDRSNMTEIFGCYVNENKEIISEFQRSTGMMSENEGEKYFALMRRTLSGTLGKNLIDISFATRQVADSDEHRFLMALRKCQLKEESLRMELYQKAIETLSFGENYLILLGFDSYDVPFKTKDDTVDSHQSDETYSYIQCAVCPVKQTQPKLQYVPEEKDFHDGGILNVVAAPEVGFLFPAFDGRTTNIYNALYYTHSAKDNHPAFAEALFHVGIPKSAFEQKMSFQGLLNEALEEDCNMDVMQTVHEQICQRIEMHKESRIPDPLTLGKEEVKTVLSSCGVGDGHLAKFSVQFDEVFGSDAQLHPQNIVDNKRFDIKMPDISIKVAPDRTDLIQTRVIGGVKYILICAEDDVEVNGVRIHIDEKTGAIV